MSADDTCRELGHCMHSAPSVSSDPACCRCDALAPCEEALREEAEKSNDEVVVALADGWSLRSGGQEFKSGSYVRLCRPDESEYAYWDKDEWRDDPELVMGAIINSAAGRRIVAKEAPTEEPDTCLNTVDGHWYVVTYGRAPYQIHAPNCPTCRRTEGVCAHCSAPVEWDEERGCYVSREPGAPDLIFCGGAEGSHHSLPSD